MKIKNFLIIFTLFMVLLCGMSAISATSDNAVDNLMSEVDLDDGFISVSNDDKAIGVDDENSALNAQEMMMKLMCCLTWINKIIMTVKY